MLLRNILDRGLICCIAIGDGIARVYGLRNVQGMCAIIGYYILF